MLIDWFTVAAQAINFLILIWLLHRFLYKPILAAIDAREKRIADELRDANTKKAAAQKERDDFQLENKTFDEQRNALLAKAADDARTERDRLLLEAHKAADELRAQQATALQSDRMRLSGEITRTAGTEVVAIARKTLADLATVSLEERIGEVFTRRLHGMDAQAKAVMGAALKASGDPAIVRSAFDLPAGPRAAIQNALNETFSADVRVRFETAADAICGIELSANGQKIAWSIADYLAALDRKIDSVLGTQTAAPIAAAPAPKASSPPAPPSTTKAAA